MHCTKRHDYCFSKKQFKRFNLKCANESQIRPYKILQYFKKDTKTKQNIFSQYIKKKTFFYHTNIFRFCQRLTALLRKSFQNKNVYTSDMPWLRKLFVCYRFILNKSLVCTIHNGRTLCILHINGLECSTTWYKHLMKRSTSLWNSRSV